MCSRAWSARSRRTTAARPKPSSTSCSTPSAGADRPRTRGDEGSAGDGDGGVDAATAEDAPALTLGRAAPHAVVDAVGQRVLEALGLHRALRADAPGLVDADAVGGEELTWCEGSAAGLEHPVLFAVIGRRVQVVHVHPSASARVEWSGSSCSTVRTGRPVPVA